MQIENYGKRVKIITKSRDIIRISEDSKGVLISLNGLAAK